MQIVCYTGTKNVGKQLAKISHGCKKDMHVTWFPELADKCQLITIVDYVYKHTLTAHHNNCSC